jgi:hypothetical protein
MTRNDRWTTTSLQADDRQPILPASADLFPAEETR